MMQVPSMTTSARFLAFFLLALGALSASAQKPNPAAAGPDLRPIFATVPDIIEGKRLAHYGIRIGNNVTIGAHAVVLSGVSIGDNAIVATGAIVSKNSQIGANEVWGGVPARRLRGGNVTD